MNNCIPHFRLRFILLITLILIYSLASAQWVKKADGLKRRSDLKETVFSNGKLYIFCGFSDATRVADSTSEVYNPATNAWRYIAPMRLKTAITHENAILVDNTIWLIGGRLGKNPGPLTSQILIYDITTNTWANGPDVRDPATGKAIAIGAWGGVLLGRTIHLFGGFTPTACDNDQDKYHLTLDVDTWLSDPSQPAKWQNNLEPLPVKKNHFSSVVLAGKIYAMGGQSGHDCGGGLEVSSCHVYNPSTNSWKQLTSLPSGRSHAEGATFAIDGKIYMTGGQGSDGNSTNKIAIFDPASNNGAGKWIENSSFTLPHIYEGLSARIVGSSFIISHGSRGSSKHPEKVTYARTVVRHPVYKFGFPSECLNLNNSSANLVKGNTWLFTIDSTKTYTTSSNAKWLVVSKNATGIANQNATDIEVTANTTGLSPGVYNATITAAGTAGGISYTAATLCVQVTVQSKTQPDSGLIGNIVSKTGRNYLLGKLAAGVKYYTDRSYQIVTAPAFLNSAVFIKPPNDDKYNKAKAAFTFTLNKKATVYIAYDSRAKSLPRWLNSWQKIAGQLVKVTDYNANYLQLYSKTYLAGQVILGGNLASKAAGVLTNYFVAAVQQPENSQRANMIATKKSNGNSLKEKLENSTSNLKVYPNPNPGDIIHIEASTFSKYEIVTITLQNVYGSVMQSTKLVTNDQGDLKASIFIKKNIAKGVYWINVFSASKSFQKKIVVN